MAKIQEAGKTRSCRTTRQSWASPMRVLYVDLEREWRGGQSQALLTLLGLRARGHHVELITPRDSPLELRSAKGGIPVYTVARVGSRGWAAAGINTLLAQKNL